MTGFSYLDFTLKNKKYKQKNKWTKTQLVFETLSDNGTAAAAITTADRDKNKDEANKK